MSRFSKRHLPTIVLCLLCLAMPVAVFSSHLSHNSGDVIEDYLKKIDYRDGTYANVILRLKEEGRYEEIISLLNFYLKIKRSSKLEFLLAQTYCLVGDNKRAFSIFRQLNDKNLAFLKYIYLGLMYEDMGKEFSAIRCYYRSLEEKDNSIALYRLGKIFYQKKEYSKAEDLFKKVLKYDPSIKLANYYLGVLYLKSKKFPLAYKYLNRAHNFYPSSKIISSKLKIVKKYLGEKYFFKKKKELLKKRKEVKLASYKPKTGDIPTIKVSVLRNIGSVGFKSSGNISLEDRLHKFSLKKDTLYTIGYSDKGLLLKKYEGNKIITLLYPPVYLAADNHPFYILGAVYGKDMFWQSVLDVPLRGSLEIDKYKDKLNVLNIINVEEYLYGVLPSEIYPEANMEALKAQAIAARTLVLKNRGRHRKEGFDFCSTVHCQVYRGMASEKIRTNRAVDDTYGEVMLYEGELIEAFYHSNCGGCLRADIFGNKPYLENKLDWESRENTTSFRENLEHWFKLRPLTFCSYTNNRSNFRWQRIYDDDDFRIAFGFSLKDIRGIRIINRGQCAHIEEMAVVINGKTVKLKGDLNLRRFWDGLRSSAFTLEVKRNPRTLFPEFLIIWGAGFGHGAGMCQEGAIRMADEGIDYKTILKHYYKGIEIEKYY